jgi:hypothetical protein
MLESEVQPEYLVHRGVSFNAGIHLAQEFSNRTYEGVMRLA